MRLYLVALVIVAVLLVNAERVTSFTDHHNGAAPKRLLRGYDENADERAIAGGGAVSNLVTKIKGGASKFNERASKLLWKVRNTEKYETKVVANLKRVKVEDTLTTSKLEKLTSQVKKINYSKNKDATLIGTLTAAYGDNALAMALASVEKNADSALAPQIQALQKAQLEKWMKDKHSVDTVFKILKMDDDVRGLTGYQILIGDKFNILDDYVKLVDPKNSEAALLDGLQAGLGGDLKLWTFLQTAKTQPSTVEKAKELETSLIAKWTREDKLLTVIFQWLKLGNVDNAFNADKLKQFVKYVDDFNAKATVNKKSVIDIYTLRFKDAVVVEKLMEAMKVPATKDVATKLQKQQLEGWINSGDVAKLEKFVPLNRGEDLITTLASKFGDNKKLTMVLEKGSISGETTELQKRLFAGWAGRDITPENVLLRVFKKNSLTATSEEQTIRNKFVEYFSTLKKNE
ncbi:RxLR effector protein [Phytophthora megakarya]|uniref:RxLR effector protein n=1 Tax=Phytophthora megakarya TaxID=4795 RepID=A0A225X2D7_9STRA|nr:RxLR effector protein [Phytophthora megakarya]